MEVRVEMGGTRAPKPPPVIRRKAEKWWVLPTLTPTSPPSLLLGLSLALEFTRAATIPERQPE